MTSSVKLNVLEGVAEITLSNPGTKNAIDMNMAHELVDACDQIDADPTVGAAIVLGADGYFCSGGARDELATASKEPVSDESVAALQTIYNGFLRVGRLQVPTIAAVRGGAVGAGANLALATDVRIFSNTARFISGFINLGIHPGGGHYSLLTRTAGPQIATALGVLGATVDGPRAVELGLAYVSVPDEDVEDEARRLAAVAGRDPKLTRAAIATLRTETGPPGVTWDAAVAMERGVQAWSLQRKGAAGWVAQSRAN